MIGIFGKYFWNIVISRLSGPKKSTPPILVIVDNTDEAKDA